MKPGMRALQVAYDNRDPPDEADDESAHFAPDPDGPDDDEADDALADAAADRYERDLDARASQ